MFLKKDDCSINICLVKVLGSSHPPQHPNSCLIGLYTTVLQLALVINNFTYNILDLSEVIIKPLLVYWCKPAICITWETFASQSCDLNSIDHVTSIALVMQQEVLKGVTLLTWYLVTGKDSVAMHCIILL